MIFNSIEFLYFMIAIYAVYYFMDRRIQNIFLLAASYFFYSVWDWRFLSLIWFSTIIDYFAARKLEQEHQEHRRKILLSISVISNLSILGFFKYFNFFVDSLVDLVGVFGISTNSGNLNIILPVGISFYTFQTLSYSIDVYRKRLKPASNFLDFALFVAFFPQLVAGPIERASHLLPQIYNTRVINWNRFSQGIYLILLGLFKKVVIADGAAPLVDSVFNSSESQTGINIAVGCCLFAIQIYGDFAGYSDVARGVAKTLGFDFMVNFNTPYFSCNPQEFWKRWHISLSTWLRDYLYISLGGNKGSQISLYRNLMLTMILGGLWHGASFNFLLWGFYQGICLCTHRIMTAQKNAHHTILRLKILTPVKIGIFFVVTCYGWLLFRAQSFQQISQFTFALCRNWQLASLNIEMPARSFIWGLPILMLLDTVQYLRVGDEQFQFSWPLPSRVILYTVMFLLILVGASNAPVEFIYFQF